MSVYRRDRAGGMERVEPTGPVSFRAAHEDLELAGMALKYRWPPPAPEVAARTARRVDRLACSRSTPAELALVAARVRDGMARTSLKAIDTALRAQAQDDPGLIGSAEFALALKARIASYDPDDPGPPPGGVTPQPTSEPPPEPGPPSTPPPAPRGTALARLQAAVLGDDAHAS